MTRRVHVRVFFSIVTLSTNSFVVLPRAFFCSFWNILFNWKCELATWTISLNWLLCCVLSLCFSPTLTLITHCWLFFFISSVHKRIKFIILSEHLDELYRVSSITASIFFCFCFFFIHWLPFNSCQWMYQRISITSRRNGPRKKRRNWNEITIWETQWMRVCVCMWGVSNFFLFRIVEKAKTRKMRTYVN